MNDTKERYFRIAEKIIGNETDDFKKYELINNHVLCHINNVIDAVDVVTEMKIGGKKMTQEEYLNILDKGVESCNELDRLAKQYNEEPVFNIDMSQKYTELYYKGNKFIEEI